MKNITTIDFNKGIRRAPSIGEEGELSDCVNLISRQGEITTLEPPIPIATDIEEGLTLAFVHMVDGKNNYIFYGSSEGDLVLKYARGEDELSSLTPISNLGLLYKLSESVNEVGVRAIGNTLVVSGDAYGYILWKDGAYKTLGSHVPALRLNIGLEPEEVSHEVKNTAIGVSKHSVDGTEEGALIKSVELSYNGKWEEYRNGVYMAEVETEINAPNGGTFPKNLKVIVNYHYNYPDGVSFYYYEENRDDTLVQKTATIQRIEGKSYYIGIGESVSKLKFKAIYTLNFNPDEYGNQFYRSVVFKIYNAISTTYDTYGFTDYKSAISNIQSFCNSFNTRARKENRFTYPFFLRYALISKDGTILSASDPIYMVPNDKPMPRIYFTDPASNMMVPLSGEVNTTHLYNLATYETVNTIKHLMDTWGDIVYEVEFYATPPIYTYNQTHEEPGKITSACIVSVDNQDESKINYSYSLHKAPVQDSEAEAQYLIEPHTTDPELKKFYIQPPGFTDDEIKESTIFSTDFRKIASFKLDYLLTSKRLVLNKGALEGLETAKQMDYNASQSFILPRNTVSYNSRLMASDTSRTINIDNELGVRYMNGALTDENPSVKAFVKMKINGAYEYLEIEGVESAIQVKNNGTIFDAGGILPYKWLYVNDIRAESIYVYTGAEYNNNNNKVTRIYDEYHLTMHPLLPGRYWFDSDGVLARVKDDGNGNFLSPIRNFLVESVYNKLYVSEAMNPFVFPETNAITLDVSRILNIAVASKPLSTGQFGQYPLYCFTTEGIWAMSIASNGAIDLKQPINTDVLSSPHSITFLHDSVAYVTNRGLMILRGSEAVCVSEHMDGAPEDTGYYQDVFTKYLTPLSHTDEGFRAILADSHLLFDSDNSLLHIFANKASNMHYIMDLENYAITKQVLDVTAKPVVVGSYPRSYLQLGTGLYKCTHRDYTDTTLRQGYLLTRMMALDNPLGRKVLMDLRVLHSCLSAPKVAVYYSNDRIHWYRLGSLKGHSAKYFRFLLLANMNNKETISGMALTHMERFPGKMR